jgi:hypothetical protein
MATKVGRKHIIIPDTQCKPGVSLDHMLWAGKYIAEKEPDVVVHIGDHWDMPSLSSYDKGKREIEGKRYVKDIEAGNEGMELFFEGVDDFDCDWHFLLGNHEDRIERATQDNPQLEGALSYDHLALADWNVHDFLRPVTIDGIVYCHYFYNPKTGRPWGGTALNILRHVGRSYVQGHRQGLDVTPILELPTGERRRGIIAGSFYQHHERYLGHQGNAHWRGLIVLHEVRDGNFDMMEVSLDYLRRRYA